jgi:hypothetical protein
MKEGSTTNSQQMTRQQIGIETYKPYKVQA